ncbi:hypothetical protein QWY85_14470 [Neolewinella lacunae]|uniref:Dockerin domain-containing protein n=1 Tax=Neolewinella lacunae TaxID=1517758 RepID=A0A923PI61_9BACT|nr:hypothetical protein [Neolewinella lacunae]MBC6993050.1 hypothetical protein [Neolewinella lacunae]MDN3635872.1 hypothetical protein [Neolewinella lacunae]
MYPRNTIFFLVLLSLAGPALLAQASAVLLPSPNLAKLAAEDERFGNPRYSAPLALDLTPEYGEYAYENGVLTWSRRFSVPAAHGLGLFLDAVELPAGATLSLHAGDAQRGPFTQADVSDLGRLFTGFLPGQEVTLRYRGPRPEKAPFHIWRIDHVYRPDLWHGGRAKDFGDSNACQINANCSAGDGWDDEKSGAARINLVVAEGVGFCTGNLINNTAQDGRPYVLTGFHCMDGFTPLYDLWELDFDYRSTGCTNPATEPTPTTYRGVEFRAGLRETDFMLLEIIDVDFAAEDHYFAGWDRSDGNAPGLARHFHHPEGDIQKLGISNAGGMIVRTTPIVWSPTLTTPANHHFTVGIATGSFQVGSSGSAFFDANRRIRGQLSGGFFNCNGTNTAFVGRLFLSWNTGATPASRLAEWLDPLGTNAMTLNGANLLPRRFVSGQVLNNGQPVEGATITFAWAPDGSQQYLTDAEGRFRGERPPLVTAFAISGTYGADLDLLTGVDVGDIIRIRRHILGLDTLTAERQVAGDVNNSGNIRVSDITQITRVILGLDDWRTRPNWLVIPAGFPLTPTPVDVGTPVGIALNNAGVFELPVNFFVLKTGDADGNAND